MSDPREPLPGSAVWSLRAATRRHFFGGCGVGVGAMALSSLMAAEGRGGSVADPLAPQAPHHAPRAKRVIFLFMAGGPSQLELFDHKPELARRSGTPIPESFVAGTRFAFMDSSHRIDLLGPKRPFRQHGQPRCGGWRGACQCSRHRCAGCGRV